MSHGGNHKLTTALVIGVLSVTGATGDAGAYLTTIQNFVVSVECFTVKPGDRLGRTAARKQDWSGVGSLDVAKIRRVELTEAADKETEARLGAKVRCRGQIKDDNGAPVDGEYWSK